jgi:hypothetical protein
MQVLFFDLDTVGKKTALCIPALRSDSNLQDNEELLENNKKGTEFFSEPFLHAEMN